MKKLIACVMIITMMCTTAVLGDEITGVEKNAGVENETTIIPDDGLELASGSDLYYDNFSSFNSYMNIKDGVATCVGMITMTESKKSEIELTLQRKGNNSGYSKYAQWSKTFSGTGTKSLRKTKAVTKGYTYRLRAVVKVYSGTKVIEANAYYSKEHKY